MSTQRPNHRLWHRSAEARTEFNNTASATREERRESFMVKRQGSHARMRPPRSLALGPDGTAFEAQWNAERQNAQSHRQGRSR